MKNEREKLSIAFGLAVKSWNIVVVIKGIEYF